MKKSLRALETTGRMEKPDMIRLDSPIPHPVPGSVRVILIFSMENEKEELEWLRAATANPAFAFLLEPKEDVYSLSDGKALTNAG